MALGVSFSGVLVSLQLVQAVHGHWFEGRAELLSLTISRVMILAGILCLLDTAVSFYRGMNSA